MHKLVTNLCQKNLNDKYRYKHTRLCSSQILTDRQEHLQWNFTCLNITNISRVCDQNWCITNLAINKKLTEALCGSAKHNNNKNVTFSITISALFHVYYISTLKKILYPHPPKHELLNQPYYVVDSTKKFSQITLINRFD